MFGNSSFAEAAFANVGGVVQIATAEMNALGTSSSIGSGTLVGVSSLSGNFTKTTAGIYNTLVVLMQKSVLIFNNQQ